MTGAALPPGAAEPPPPDLVRLAEAVAAQLRDATAAVTISEFRAQETGYDEHSRNGRELLYLAANDDWNRGTREVVRVVAANVVDTSFEVHVDLSRVTHEAFRERTGTVWLPLLVLPPVTDPGSGARRPVAPSPRVTDAAGATLPPLPQSEARQWTAAALTEIMLNLAPLVAPPGEALTAVRREHRLLLSAAVHRVLRDGTDGSGSGPGLAQSSAPDGSRVGRVENARRELHVMLDGFRRTVADPGEDQGRAALLIRRAAQIMHAISHPTSLVVVGVPAEGPATAFTVAIPSRSLHGNPRAWFRGPRARIELDLLLPSVDADRAVEVELPPGVSLPRERPSGVTARVEVDRPRAMRQLDELMRQIGARSLTEPGRDPVLRCLVDFALARVEVARDAFRCYRASPDEAAGARPVTEAVPEWMESMRAALHNAAALPGDAAADDPALAEVVQRGRELARVPTQAPAAQPGLFRVLEAAAVNPTTAHVRIPAVDSVEVRASPRSAHVTVDAAVDEAGPVHAARYSGLMSLLILAVVVADLKLFGNSFDAQVLGGVLTLFAVIQAGRVEHPDRTTLRGLLVSSGSWVVLASVLPTVLLGVTLAFVGVDGVADADTRRALVPWLAGAALLGQTALQLLMHVGPPAGNTRSRSTPRLRLRTGQDPDHLRVDVLRSSWWRTTTAGALLLGRRAHAYVVRQQDGDIGAVLDTGANILAMLRAGTHARTLTFVVFREEPNSAWQARNTPVELPMDADRLLASEAKIGNVDIFLGMPPGDFTAIASHPLSRILAEARARDRAVFDVQFPATPPPGGSRLLTWTRVRIGLRSNETGDLGDFLDAVHARAGAGAELLVDMASQTPPRRLLGTSLPADGPLTALRPDELDVVGRAPAAGLSPDGVPGPEWFVLAVTGYARNGIEADVLEALARQRPALRLAGLSTALMHGLTVMFVLGHQPGRTAADSAPRLALDDAQVLVAEWTDVASLGRQPDDDAGALVRLHVVSSDRPGTFSTMLERLAHAFGLASARPSMPVWYAHTEVLDGRISSSRVMVRVPAYLAGGRWDRSRLDAVERSVRQALAQERTSTELPGWSDARPVVGLDVVRAAALPVVDVRVHDVPSPSLPPSPSPSPSPERAVD